MKKIFCLALVILSIECHIGTMSIYAQKEGQVIIDSLMNELPKAKKDTNHVNILTAICFYYYEINPTLGLKYGKEALELAESIHYENGKAHAYGNLACNYLNLSDYPNALKLWTKSLEIHEKLGKSQEVATTFLNMANVYESQGDYSKALELNFNALNMFEKNGGKGSAVVIGNIGYIYFTMNDNVKALEYYHRSLELYQKEGRKSGIAAMLGYMGEVYGRQSEYSKAIEYLINARNMNRELGIKLVEAYNIKTIGSVYLQIAKDTVQKNSAYILFNKKNTLARANAYIDTAIIRFREIGELNTLFRCYQQLSEIKELLGEHTAALESYKKYSNLKDSVFNNEKSKGISQTQIKYEQDKLDIQNQNELQEQKIIRNGFIVGFSIVLLFAGVFLVQRNRIKKGKHQSDELLLNILPAEVADELKNKGSASAKQFDNVTVLFTDFISFTTVSEQLTPQELVDELHSCFKGFDEIMEKYGIEKIKTIGDAYLAVCGLPQPNEKHAENVVYAAIEIKEFMENRRQTLGEKTFGIRIGLNSGSVVAGIVGVKKFAYDIWGDTVNTAARMEQNSEAGKINISEATYKIVKDKFSCEYRGEIDAKNKGMMKMYFVGKERN